MVRIVECYQATFAHPMTFSCMLWCLQAGGGQEGYQKHDWDLEAQQQEEEEEARRHHREVGACRCSLCRAVQPPKRCEGGRVRCSGWAAGKFQKLLAQGIVSCSTLRVPNCALPIPKSP
eukprot:1153814-Pelagomonas_calceolata.AAC.7